MAIGKRNRLVTIQQPGTAQDELGQPIPGWSDLASVFAEIRYLNGMETIKAGAEAAVRNVSMRINYRTDVSAAMRVSHGTTVFQVKSVQPDEVNRKHVDLVCEEIV